VKIEKYISPRFFFLFLTSLFEFNAFHSRMTNRGESVALFVEAPQGRRALTGPPAQLREDPRNVASCTHANTQTREATCFLEDTLSLSIHVNRTSLQA